MPLTDDPSDSRLGRGVDAEPRAQHEVYLVLSEEERAKGFVRPVRESYVHSGRAICGQVADLANAAPAGKVFACSGQPGHEGDCSSWLPVTPAEAERGVVGGCGTLTRMGLELAETYARDPRFYGATYCCGCRMHLPVGPWGEFVWADEHGSSLPLRVGE